MTVLTDFNPAKGLIVPASGTWQPDSVCTVDTIWYDADAGYLYIDCRKTASTCLRIGSWEQGLPVARWNEWGRCWENDNEWDPGFTIHQLRFLNAGVQNSYHEFVATIPERARLAVEPFEWRQFVLLKMIRYTEHTLELIKSNPVLAWLLADTLAVREIPLQAGCEWVSKKRRDILGFCGGPQSDSAVAVLNKVKAERFTQVVFEDLVRILHNETWMKQARTLPVIHGRTLFHLSRNFDFIYWLNTRSDYAHLVTTYSPLSREPEVVFYSLWTDAVSIGHTLLIADPVAIIKRCKTIADLQQLATRWSDRYNRTQKLSIIQRYINAYKTNRLPTAPINGTADIVAVETIEMLAEEASVMHNCILSYVPKISRMESFLYRVINPERATVELVPSVKGYRIKQIKTVCNGQPNAATRAMVEEWLISKNSNTQSMIVENIR